MANELSLRPWQNAACGAWERSRPTSQVFTEVASPGTGKTISALAKYLLDRGKYFDKLIVVSPTAKVRSQWKKTAQRFGIKLMVQNGDAMRWDMFDGVSMSYQQLDGLATRLAAFCQMYRVMVVLDEPHHMADERTWGVSAQRAFARAKRILLETGTPFRSDDARIPFLRYLSDGTGVADFVYGLPEAIYDDVCRSPRFVLQDAVISWDVREEKNGIVRVVSYKADLSDVLESREHTSRRLRVALDPAKGIVHRVLRQANQKLVELRLAQPDAGGLVICKDIRHAKRVALVLAHITGKAPVVVHSDDDNAIRSIDAFAVSDAPWIVSVAMISEGTDIPRLRVAVLLTNVKTDMFFRQAIGRVVRKRPGEINEKAYIYLPADPDFIRMAAQVEEEIHHMLGDDGEKVARKKKELPNLDDRVIRTLIPVATDATDATEIEGGTVVTTEDAAIDLQAQIMELRREINRVANIVAKTRGVTPQTVHGWWIADTGKRTRDMDITWLRKKLAWLIARHGLEATRQVYRPRAVRMGELFEVD